jgi:predicted transcriptional regulator
MNLIELKSLIAESGLKNKWIAKKLDIHHTALSQYLNDFRPMPEEVKKGIIKIIK